jgi:hypothetical protein
MYPPNQCTPELFPREKADQGVKISTRLHPVLCVRTPSALYSAPACLYVLGLSSARGHFYRDSCVPYPLSGFGGIEDA